jgi:Zn-dependent protease with chaperone function
VPPITASVAAPALTGVRRERAGAPPWLWMVTALGINPIGLTIAAGLLLYDNFRGLGDFAHHAGFLQWLVFLAIFLPLLGLAGFIPLGALFVGSLSVFQPKRRQEALEKEYALAPLDTGLPVCREIAEFVHGRYPQVTLTANLLRTSLLAFVYPDGATTVRLAVFGGLLKLWASDRAAAQAVLLHELAHCRRGDALHIGVGSGFVRSLQIAAGSLAASLALWLVIRVMSAQLFTMAVVGAVQAFSIYVVLIAAIWSAEFNADRLAAEDFGPGGLDAVGRALRLTEVHETGWRAWLSRLTHPPLKLRLRMLRREGWAGLFALNMAYPLGLLAASALRWAAPWLLRLLTGPIPESHMQFITEDHFTQNIMYENTSYIVAWMGLMMWPWIHQRRATAWSHQKVQRIPGPAGAYIAASALCFALFIGAFLLSSATDEFALGIKPVQPTINIDWEKINQDLSTPGNPGYIPPGGYDGSLFNGGSTDSSGGSGSDSSSDPYQYGGG